MGATTSGDATAVQGIARARVTVADPAIGVGRVTAVDPAIGVDRVTAAVRASPIAADRAPAIAVGRGIEGVPATAGGRASPIAAGRAPVGATMLSRA